MGINPLNAERSAGAHHEREADRLLAKATAEADNGRYRRAQTLLELSEAHTEAATRSRMSEGLRGIR